MHPHPHGLGAACESPIEEEFAYNLAKYLAPKTELRPQADVETSWGRFRLDFLITSAATRVAVECDGREFHDADRDEWRDAILLGSSCADVVYRFRGSSIFSHCTDCIYVMSLLDPSLFDERGRINLLALASDDVRGTDWPEEAESALERGYYPRLLLEDERRSRTAFAAKTPPFIKRYYDYACANGPAPLDTLRARWRVEHGIAAAAHHS